MIFFLSFYFSLNYYLNLMIPTSCLFDNSNLYSFILNFVFTILHSFNSIKSGQSLFNRLEIKTLLTSFNFNIFSPYILFLNYQY